MNTKYIFEFIQIVNSGSFSEAAEELYISQSSLSKHIASLEDYLGVRLFDRTTRKINLTQAGLQFLPFAEAICETELNALKALKKFCPESGKKLLITGLVVMSFYGVLSDIAKFQKLHPEIDIEIAEYNGNQIVKSLTDGDFELAFYDSSIFTNAPDISTIHYNEDYLVAAIHKDHPLAKEDVIDVRLLSKERLLFVDNTSPLYDISYKLCQDVGFTPNIFFAGVRLENLFELVSLNKGIAFLAKKCTTLNKPDSVCIKEITPRATRNIVLARNNKLKLSRDASAFWNYILHKNNHKLSKK
jgi:DNA-binding transcriptional LysR family regulator